MSWRKLAEVRKAMEPEPYAAVAASATAPKAEEVQP